MPSRVFVALKNLALRPHSRPVLCSLEDGRPFLIRPNDFTQCARVVSEWEAMIYEALRPLVPADGVVLDVGAQVGISAIEFARWVSSGGHVYCFEPVPVHAAQLRENLRLNALDGRATVAETAISDAEGSARFHYSMRNNSGMGSLRAGAFQDETITVTTTTLDRWRTAAALHDVHLVKIDIEGAEGLALAGMAAGLEDKAYRALLVEVHPAEIKGFGQRAEKIPVLLEAAGYSLFWWVDGAFVPFAPAMIKHGYLLALSAAGLDEARRSSSTSIAAKSAIAPPRSSPPDTAGRFK